MRESNKMIDEKRYEQLYNKISANTFTSEELIEIAEMLSIFWKDFAQSFSQIEKFNLFLEKHNLPKFELRKNDNKN